MTSVDRCDVILVEIVINFELHDRTEVLVSTVKVLKDSVEVRGLKN